MLNGAMRWNKTTECRVPHRVLKFPANSKAFPSSPSTSLPFSQSLAENPATACMRFWGSLYKPNVRSKKRKHVEDIVQIIYILFVHIITDLRRRRMHKALVWTTDYQCAGKKRRIIARDGGRQIRGTLGKNYDAKKLEHEAAQIPHYCLRKICPIADV